MDSNRQAKYVILKIMITKEEMKIASKAYHQLQIAYKEFIGKYFSNFGMGAKSISQEELIKIRAFRLKIEDAKTKLTTVRTSYYSIN